MAEKTNSDPEYRPNRPLRRVLQFLARLTLRGLTDLEIDGEENFPKSGPFIMVANHFSFIDPVAFVSLSPWQLDFIGGAVIPHAPRLSASFHVFGDICPFTEAQDPTML